MAEGSKDFMRELLTTGIVGTEWPKVTYLIVYIKDKDGKVIYNKHFDSKDHTHTEEKMLKDHKFLEQVKTEKIDITLTLNYSPCSDCASKLEEFYNSNITFIESFTIRFSFLYNKKDPANQVGLKNLNKAGITLEAMTEESWFDVFMWFTSHLELAHEVRKRDDDTREELKEVLDKVPETGQVAGVAADQEIEALTQWTKTLSLQTRQQQQQQEVVEEPLESKPKETLEKE